MVFSSTIFLFLFLPLVLGLYFLVRPGLRNGVLLLASLTYYAWGESKFLRLVLFSILGNYLFGLTIQALHRPRLHLILTSGQWTGASGEVPDGVVFLQKPYSKDQLLDAVYKALGRPPASSPSKD